jgi:hypothetical protein
MVDYLISGVIIIFIIMVLVWIKRRETREKLAAEAQTGQVAPASEPAPASQNQPASANQLAADGQQRDGQHRDGQRS